MTKPVLLAGGLAVVVAVIVGQALLGMVSVLFAGAAQSLSCSSSTAIVVPAGGPVRFPVVGRFVVTSDYGYRYNPGNINHGEYRLHAGIDLAEIPAPTTVVAALAGVVVATTRSTTGGLMVTIDHGGGLVTKYMHLSATTVHADDKVWAGRPIGHEGNTGNVSKTPTSEGFHLHFQIERNGTPIKPRDWMTAQGLTVPPVDGQGTAPAAVTTPAPTPDTLDPAATPTPALSVAPSPVGSALPAKVGPYSGQQVTNAAYIIRAGQAMSLDARTITIGVMTAMGESSLINVDRGDTVGPDSRGLFQQRANGAWGSYSDRMNPTIASTNFFKALIAVPGYASLEPTIAAHRTQRNADPFFYRRFWADAVVMVATLTKDPSLLESLPNQAAACPATGLDGDVPTTTGSPSSTAPSTSP
jgi:hypothetical protein